MRGDAATRIIATTRPHRSANRAIGCRQGHPAAIGQAPLADALGDLPRSCRCQGLVVFEVPRRPGRGVLIYEFDIFGIFDYIRGRGEGRGAMLQGSALAGARPSGSGMRRGPGRDAMIATDAQRAARAGIYCRAYDAARGRIADLERRAERPEPAAVLRRLVAQVSREMGDDDGAAQRVIGWAAEDAVAGWSPPPTPVPPRTWPASAR